MMKIYDDITPALSTILLHYTRGYSCWLSIKTTKAKLEALDQKFAINYGTRLAAYQRQDKKQKSLPTAVAVAAPVLGEPDSVEVILLATVFAKNIEVGAFSKEKWKSSLPEFSKFVMVHEPRDRGDYAWSWKIQGKELGQLENFMKHLVTTGDISKLAAETHHWVKFYPMFGGVRRQIRRTMRGGQKLWAALFKERAWPGPDPDHLPMMIGFKKTSSTPSEQGSH